MKKKHFSLILIVGLSVMLLLSIGAGFLVGYFFVRGMWAVSVPVFIALAILLTIVLVIIREKYNYAMLVPLARLKVRLRTINTGQFEKISISKENAEMLPIVNEINEIAENINALNKVRSEFFANASHELNTPLTYISGYAELMEQGILVDKNKIVECGSKIREQAGRMEGLISDMLKLSKLENSQAEIVFDEVNIKELLGYIVETLKMQALKRNIRVNVYCYQDIIISNEDLLKDILLNLVQNGVKYNKENGSVNIIVKRIKKQIEITVADTGLGMSKEDSLRIFERFYRVDKSRSDKGGTGLGLAIAKHSAMKLDGTITIESKLGEGTKFTVILPEKQL